VKEILKEILKELREPTNDPDSKDLATTVIVDNVIGYAIANEIETVVFDRWSFINFHEFYAHCLPYNWNYKTDKFRNIKIDIK